MRYGLLFLALLFSTNAAQSAEFCVSRVLSPLATHLTIADALTAAAANGPGEDLIRLDSNYTHMLPNTVAIRFQSVVIAGGYPDCQSVATSVNSLIDGAGGTAGSVFAIGDPTAAQAEVTFRRVVIFGGEDDGSGGGLDVVGPNLTLRLESGTQVGGNRSSLGGGIYVRGATLILGPGTNVSYNHASVDGGGVYCDGAAATRISATGDVIGNRAIGSGGGFALGGNCQLSATGGTATQVSFNIAGRYGGGIYLSGTQASAEARRGPLGGTLPIRIGDSVLIRGNVAGTFGGGVMADNRSRFTASGITITENEIRFAAEPDTQPRGAGVFAGTGATFRMQHDAHCPPNEPCNLIEGNIIDTAPGYGAAVAGYACSTIEVENALLRNNAQRGSSVWASHGIAVSARRCGDFALRNSVVYGNRDDTNKNNLLDIDDTTQSILDYLIITDNHLPGAGSTVMSVRAGSPSYLLLRSSIIYQPTLPSASVSGPLTQYVDCLLADDLATNFPAALRSLQGAPSFVNAAQNNYRASPGALQIDYCDGSAGTEPDADGGTRPYDVPGTQRYGAYDLGAYENRPAVADPPIFKNGFEIP